MYAWYRALAARQGRSPIHGVHELPSSAFARSIFICWVVGVPILALGLAHQHLPAIALSAATLLVGVAVSAAYLVHMLRKAQRSNDAPGHAYHA